MKDEASLAFREKLAAIEHERWSDWQNYMHSKCIKDENGNLVIPASLVKHWERLIDTCYEDMTEREKDSDREQVDRYWALIREAEVDGGD